MRSAALASAAMTESENERGSASVEQAGLAALVALLLVAAIAAVASGGEIDAGRQLAGALGRRLTCAPRLPDARRPHPPGPPGPLPPPSAGARLRVAARPLGTGAGAKPGSDPRPRRPAADAG